MKPIQKLLSLRNILTIVVPLVVLILAIFLTSHWQHQKLLSASFNSASNSAKLGNLESQNNQLNNELKEAQSKVSSQGYTSGAACQSSQLSLAEYGNIQGLTGNREAFFSVTNTSSYTCTLNGYPTFVVTDASGQPTQGYGGNSPAKNAGNYFTQDPGPQKVTLAKGSSAYFSVGWVSETQVSPEYAESIMPGTQTSLIAAVHGFDDWSAPETITALAPLSAYSIQSLGLQE